IRPEHLKPSVKNPTNTNHFSVEVIHVEVLGNETILAFNMGDQEWLAKWNGQWRIRVNQTIPISIDYDSICLFDGTTQELLKSPSNIENHVIDTEVIL
ncbi:TOBE domain-containing protein, partial [Paenibacillus phytohabitans]